MLKNRTIYSMLKIVLLSSIVMLCSCNNQNNDNNDNTSINNENHSVDIESTITTVEKETMLTQTTTDLLASNTNIHAENNLNVEILSPDNNLIEKRTGSLLDLDLNRPASLKRSEVFKGWQEDIISQINNTSSKETPITLTVESTDISNIDNVIYNDATFVNMTSNDTTIPVIVGGNVNFSVLELELTYDPSILQFDSFVNKDSDVECNCSEPGVIFISFLSNVNVTADVELCNIKFNNISQQATDTMIKYNVKDMAAWNNDKTDYVDVNHETINGKIVMF